MAIRTDLPTDLAQYMHEHDLTSGELFDKLGMRISAASPDRVEGSMPVTGNTQPYGYLHGGASIAFAETLASVAAMLACEPGQYAVGTDIAARHRRPAGTGDVAGVATLVKSEDGTRTYEVTVRDIDMVVTSICTITCAIRSFNRAPVSAGRS